MGQAIRIVMADDNQDFVEILKQFFSAQKDMEVVGVAYNGAEAIDILRSRSCDVVILDMIMPNVDGLGVIEAMQNVEEKPKFIILSSFGHETVTKKAIGLGVSYFLMKPFDLDVLGKRIRQLFEEKKFMENIDGGTAGGYRLPERNSSFVKEAGNGDYTLGQGSRPLNKLSTGSTLSAGSLGGGAHSADPSHVLTRSNFSGSSGLYVSSEHDQALQNGHTTKKYNSQEWMLRITQVIQHMGVPAHVKGYQYLRDAIMAVLDDGELIGRVTRELYPKIAEMHNTSATRVERAIRHSIELAWDRGNIDYVNRVFGYTINVDRGKPTNSEFIALIADRLKMCEVNGNTDFKMDMLLLDQPLAQDQ